MNDALLAKVDSQLLEDLRHYGIASPDLRIDWSRGCMEGHGIHHLGGYIESNSAVCAVDSLGRSIAGGWVEFFYHEEDDFLQAFWRDLYVYDPEDSAEHGKLEEHIYECLPWHVWISLPEKYREGTTRHGITLYNYRS